MKRIEIVIGDHGHLDSSITVDGLSVLASRIEVAWTEVLGAGHTEEKRHLVAVPSEGQLTCMTLNVHGTKDEVWAPVRLYPGGIYRVEWTEENGRPVPR